MLTQYGIYSHHSKPHNRYYEHSAVEMKNQMHTKYVFLAINNFRNMFFLAVYNFGCEIYDFSIKETKKRH